ncbi:MAG TPA: zf-HC2 domain-containing protein [Candidatus Edwardsbacteria bacterium]|nr:zf-HC2 domain-containing protein [Candidatus Edwardsbacteria bacterium]
MRHKHTHGPQGHCRRMVSAFSDYLDKDLQQQVCRQVERHLKDCPDCKLYLDTLNKTITLYRGLGDVPVPKDVESRLFATIRLESFQRRTASKGKPKRNRK